MSGVTVPLGSVQKLPGIAITPRATVVQPTTWYTCPAGKKAKVKGLVTCQGFGAATTASLLIGGTEIAEWDLVGCDTGNNTPLSLCADHYFEIDVELEAGDTVQTTQNSGTNAEFNVFLEVQETPA